MRLIAIVLGTLLLAPASLSAEEACVKYHKCISLDQFKCEDITRSSFIRRVCYVEAKQYMIIKLKDTYYHYCKIGPETVTSLMEAPSMGKYFNEKISGTRNNRGPFDCRDHPIPDL